MEKKICSTCKVQKLITEFSFKNKEKNKLQSQCKECQKGPRNDWYARNRERHSINTSRNRELATKAARSYILNYLLTNPCIDCGETDPRVLEFDHVRGQKERALSEASRAGWSIEKIKKEIDKCDVRCSNCHKRKTAKDQNWYSDWEFLIEEKNKHLVPW